MTPQSENGNFFLSKGIQLGFSLDSQLHADAAT
jgi:hypothetical protein